MRPDLPAGTVTFVFTDVEGSTRLLEELGPSDYAQRLGDHRRLVRHAFGSHGGVEVDTQGDAFFYAFADAGRAVTAATDAQERLGGGQIRVRMGIHTGEPTLADEGYVGRDVHLAARIAAAGHGGQVLISRETRGGLADSVAVTDLGEHRLKDFNTPVWLYQLGGDRFPPLRTISNTNLPRPVSSFVGRRREVAEITALLRDSARLLTLTGPGGTGKTRLAIEAAADLVADFRNGVFWVDLAPLRDHALASEEIGRTIGAVGGVAEHIGQRQMLLVVDNLEQVIGAAPDLAGLLERCPNLRTLTTSRELLRVRGEVEYVVEPLATDEAVELFCARSQLPPDDTIAELCRRLDSLPLAIELAAARTRLMTTTQILDRLGQRLDLLRGGRDSAARQQTLRATIEWSYDLLLPAERDAFARLAAFRGGFTLEAAEAIGAADVDEIQSLVDKSLVRRRNERFAMLETVLQFATERLAQMDDAGEVGRRHAEHFLALAEDAEPHLPAYDREWVERLETEHDNLRAAFDFYQGVADGQAMQRLAGALARFWFMRGHVLEGRRRVEVALAADDRPTAARASAFLGSTLVSLGDNDTNAAAALALFRRLGDRRGEALAVLQLGNAAAVDGDWAKAAELVESGLTTLRELGEQHHALIAARGLGWIYANAGEREKGISLHHDTLGRARELGNKRIEAIVTGALAMETLASGRPDEALELLLESQKLHTELGDPFAAAINVFRFAALLLARGRTETAAKLAACADALIAELGLSLRDWDPVFIDEINAGIRAGLNESTLARATDEGARMTAEAAVNLALAELALDQPRSASGT